MKHQLPLCKRTSVNLALAGNNKVVKLQECYSLIKTQGAKTILDTSFDTTGKESKLF